MNDVAQEAGVALKTVSRFVNGQTNINPVMAERIAKAIVQLGYRRNLAAAAIRPGQSTKTLGLIISDLANPYYSTLTRAIETYVRERGYLLFSASSDEDGARHDELVDRMMQQQVDGLFIVPPRHSEREWKDVRPPIPPIVFLDRPVESENAITILADNTGGAYAATTQLIEGGAQKVAFVGDDLRLYTMAERYKGYQSALADHGQVLDDALVFTHAHSSAEAAAAVERLLTTTDMDAIFAANNRASIGALMAFRAQSRRLGLIGFDDFEAALLSDPQTSVVSQDIALMGTMAAEMLLARIPKADKADHNAADSTQTSRLALPTRLILRGSELA